MSSYYSAPVAVATVVRDVQYPTVEIDQSGTTAVRYCTMQIVYGSGELPTTGTFPRRYEGAPNVHVAPTLRPQ